MNNGIFVENLCSQRIEENIIKGMEAAVSEGLRQHCSQEADVFISITDAGEIRQLNMEARGIDSATDVLSFPYIDFANGQSLEVAATAEHMLNPETGRVMLGDIVICLERATEQAEEYGHSLLREMAFLSVHGLLHLLGFDHEQDDDARRMFAAQEEILNGCGISR